MDKTIALIRKYEEDRNIDKLQELLKDNELISDGTIIYFKIKSTIARVKYAIEKDAEDEKLINKSVDSIKEN